MACTCYYSIDRYWLMCSVCVCVLCVLCVCCVLCVWAHASHLPVAKCRGKESCNIQDGYFNWCYHWRLYPTSLISWVLQAHRWDPHNTEGAAEIRLASLLPKGPPVLLLPAGSPFEWGHIVRSRCGNTSTGIRLASLLPMGLPVFLPPNGSPHTWVL